MASSTLFRDFLEWHEKGKRLTSKQIAAEEAEARPRVKMSQCHRENRL